MLEFLNTLGDVLDIFKIVGPMLVIGAAQKHLTKIPNDTIPWVNGVLGAAVATLATPLDIWSPI